MTGIMNDKKFEKLIKTIDVEATPPEGLKEKLLISVMASEHKTKPLLTPLERFIFEKPLRAACTIAIPISGFLWAVLGNGFAKLFVGIIR